MTFLSEVPDALKPGTGALTVADGGTAAATARFAFAAGLAATGFSTCDWRRFAPETGAALRALAAEAADVAPAGFAAAFATPADAAAGFDDEDLTAFEADATEDLEADVFAAAFSTLAAEALVDDVARTGFSTVAFAFDLEAVLDPVDFCALVFWAMRCLTSIYARIHTGPHTCV